MRNRSNHPMTAPLINSDREYFEMGAEVAHVAGARLVYMPDLLDVAAGCVALCNRTPTSQDNAFLQLDRLERQIRSIGSSSYRLYDYTSNNLLAEAARERGYSSSSEIGMISESMAPHRGLDVRLKPVIDEQDWQAKLEVHRSDQRAPDGHLVLAERWLEMERCKHATGELQFFLAEWNGAVCGTVGAMRTGGLLRMKNLVVSAPLRKLGIGSAITVALSKYADAAGCCAMGLMALEESPAFPMYLRLGLQPITRQVEWVRTA